ncbi:T9SS type A sorting domain-containing protein [Hymenobacter armeniacus]|uniref:T9SS type A sorting domain-containing protein n=1 Tax=Hymenobacter armeniacus TaxID=2771358 RepID=A0ABR8JXA2_9BACT|nr:T9SS type A sorting domain-containing protein [Hymenobacter armeniacus]MBD2723957.1 T9SS type A sorting domain-containing protein [Hymenobacter armeniacus]
MANFTFTFFRATASWNRNASFKKSLLVFVVLLSWSLGAAAQTTYYWRGTVSSRWNDAGNWNTQTNGSGSTRATPADDDILIFSGNIGATFPNPIIVNYGNGASSAFSQTVGKLRVVNSADINLAGPTNGNDGSIINVGGGPQAPLGDDFFIESGSNISFVSSGQTANRFLHIKLASGRKGLVAGNIAVNSGNLTRLLATDANGLVFTGSSNVTVYSITGSPFGTTGANTVVGSNNSPLANFSDVVPANAVTFSSGTTFEQRGGTNPFGTGTTPVVSFAPGSKYKYVAGTFSDVGQTYGYLEFAGNLTTTVAGSQRLTVANDLTASAGTTNINVTGTGATGGVFIGGNMQTLGGTLNFVPATASELNVDGITLVTSTISYTPTVSGNVTLNGSVAVTSGGSLTFNGAVANVRFLGSNFNNDGLANFAQGSNSTVSFQGTSAQVIGGASSTAFGANTSFEINNPAGVTVGRSFTVRRGLLLTSGLLYTDRASGNLLTLAANATVTGGSNASHVSGYMARQTPATVVAGAPLSMLYPVGKNGVYRPFVLNITTQSSTSGINYVGEMQDTPPTQSVVAPLVHVSYRRYLQLAPDVAPSGFSGTVTMFFATDDYVNDPQASSFVMAKNNVANGAWSSIGNGGAIGTANNGLPVSGSLTSAPFTTFSTGSNFSLASTVASVGFPGTNPLPVQLTRFAANTKGNGIALDWATATEKNSAYFEVQRSANSETFRTIEKVQALGSSTTTHTYATLDRAPLAGLNYYRLRQVDADGKESYSSVVSARWSAVTAVELYPNPSSDKVYLNGLDGTVRFRVLNEMGKTLMSGETTGAAGVSVQTLPAGMYLLELVTETGRTVQRFARQ